MPSPAPPPKPTRRQRGFEPAAGLLKDRIRVAGEARGFAVTRLLTHWADIVGADLAAQTRPVKVGFARDGFGGTLTILAAGAVAPLVEMQKPRLRERVNACYGYNAVSRIVITQTAASGFAEGQAVFTHAEPAARAEAPITPKAAKAAEGIADEALRAALERLAANVLSRTRN